jgi:hypothetical protein
MPSRPQKFNPGDVLIEPEFRRKLNALVDYAQSLECHGDGKTIMANRLPGGTFLSGKGGPVSPAGGGGEIGMTALDFYRSLGIQLTVGETFEIQYSLPTTGWSDNRTETFSSTVFTTPGAFKIYYNQTTAEFFTTASPSASPVFMAGEIGEDGTLISIEKPSNKIQPVKILLHLFGELSRRAAAWDDGYLSSNTDAFGFFFGFDAPANALFFGYRVARDRNGKIRYRDASNPSNDGYLTLSGEGFVLLPVGEWTVWANPSGTSPNITFSPSLEYTSGSWKIMNGFCRADGSIQYVSKISSVCRMFLSGAGTFPLNPTLSLPLFLVFSE